MNPLTVEELQRIIREIDARREHLRGRRKFCLWYSAAVDEGTCVVLDTRSIQGDRWVRVRGPDEFPPDHLVVCMNPRTIAELRASYKIGEFPVTDAFIASTMIDYMVQKKPNLREAWGW